MTEVLVVISGGGGVGAKAIPVIGNDGGILDVKLIHGGLDIRLHQEFL